MFNFKTFILHRICLIYLLNYLSVHGIVFIYFLQIVSNLYRKMPRALSDVWRHFTLANVEGKAVYIFKLLCQIICKESNKDTESSGQVHKVPSALTTSNLSQKSLYFYSRWKLWIRRLIESNSSWSYWNKKFCWLNADECLARAVFATGSPLMLTGNVYWKRFLNVLCPAYTPPTRHALSTHLLDTELKCGQTNHKESRLYCYHLWWVVECSWARNN